MKLCDTCIYRNENEYHKPCIVYRDDCEFYEKERGDMTREDAIERLNAIKQFIGYDKDSEIVKATQKSIDMAIKALEQKPCEDAISREDLEECKELMTDINGDTVYAVRMSDIRQLSSVNLKEPKTDVLDKIRAEIEKPLHDERCFDTADAKAQYIALNWCIEIIDKYRAESEG